MASRWLLKVGTQSPHRRPHAILSRVRPNSQPALARSLSAHRGRSGPPRMVVFEAPQPHARRSDRNEHLKASRCGDGHRRPRRGRDRRHRDGRRQFRKHKQRHGQQQHGGGANIAVAVAAHAVENDARQTRPAAVIHTGSSLPGPRRLRVALGIERRSAGRARCRRELPGPRTRGDIPVGVAASPSSGNIGSHGLAPKRRARAAAPRRRGSGCSRSR